MRQRKSRALSRRSGRPAKSRRMSQAAGGYGCKQDLCAKSPVSCPNCLGFTQCNQGFPHEIPGCVPQGASIKVGGTNLQANTTELWDGTGALVVEAFSKNHAVSVWSEADPPRGNDKPSRYETVSSLSPSDVTWWTMRTSGPWLRTSGLWESQTSSFSAGLCSNRFINYISADSNASEAFPPWSGHERPQLVVDRRWSGGRPDAVRADRHRYSS